MSKPALVLALLLVSCTMRGPDLATGNRYADFFRSTTTEQIRKFKNFGVDEQYSLFLYGNQVMHPPALYLARPFALNGLKAIPFLEAKLLATKSELTIRDISKLVLEIATLNQCDFPYDSDLVALLSKRANAMGGIWKNVTLQTISDIKAQANSNGRAGGCGASPRRSN